MKRTLLFPALTVMLFAASCKETLQPITVDSDNNASDKSYTEAVEPAEARRFYVEELTGVKCPNCPAGAEELHTLSTSGEFAGQLSVVAFHAGTANFITPIKGASTQNFQTKDGQAIWQNIWGGSDSKPCAVMDRIKELTTSNNSSNRIYNVGKGTWKPALIADMAKYPTTPVNVYLESKFNSDSDRYDIVVKVKYTKDVQQSNALHIMLSQDSIIDAQQFSGVGEVYDTFYVFNHVFRRALTNSVNGKVILPDMQTKKAGLVYEYRTFVKLDANDDKQKYWDADHMHLNAFVAVADDPQDFHVMQVKDTKLKN